MIRDFVYSYYENLGKRKNNHEEIRIQTGRESPGIRSVPDNRPEGKQRAGKDRRQGRTVPANPEIEEFLHTGGYDKNQEEEKIPEKIDHKRYLNPIWTNKMKN